MLILPPPPFFSSWLSNICTNKHVSILLSNYNPPKILVWPWLTVVYCPKAYTCLLCLVRREVYGVNCTVIFTISEVVDETEIRTRVEPCHNYNKFRYNFFSECMESNVTWYYSNKGSSWFSFLDCTSSSYRLLLNKALISEVLVMWFDLSQVKHRLFCFKYKTIGLWIKPFTKQIT